MSAEKTQSFDARRLRELAEFARKRAHLERLAIDAFLAEEREKGITDWVSAYDAAAVFDEIAAALRAAADAAERQARGPQTHPFDEAGGGASAPQAPAPDSSEEMVVLSAEDRDLFDRALRRATRLIATGKPVRLGVIIAPQEKSDG